jgi:hypothetical protein
LIVILALLAGLFVFVLVVSFRAVRVLVGEGGLEARAFFDALGRALERDHGGALAALAEGDAYLERALGAGLSAKREGGRAALGAREVAIEARQSASRALTPLRIGATLGSVLGLLGALYVYMMPPPEALPLAWLERGAMEMAVMGQAALSLLAGLGVHAYAIQAYSALRGDAAGLLRDLAALHDILAALDLDGHRASREPGSGT